MVDNVYAPSSTPYPTDVYNYSDYYPADLDYEPEPPPPPPPPPPPSPPKKKGFLDSALGWAGNRVSQATHAIAKNVDFSDSALEWAGNKIDQGVHSLEKVTDNFRQDVVKFGEQHGGVAGKWAAGFVSSQIGLTEGALLAVYDMGKGAVQLVNGARQLTSPVEWAVHPGENLARLKGVGSAGMALIQVSNPVMWAIDPKGSWNTAKALGNGLTQGYREAAKSGDWSKFTGRLAVDVGSFFVGAGEANAAMKGAEAAGTASHLAEGAADVGRIAPLKGQRWWTSYEGKHRQPSQWKTVLANDAGHADIVGLWNGFRDVVSGVWSKFRSGDRIAPSVDVSIRRGPPAGVPFDPHKAGIQWGVDPWTVPIGNQGTLSKNHLRFLESHPEYTSNPIEVGEFGTQLVEGNNRLELAKRASNWASRPIDVFNKSARPHTSNS